MSGGTFVPHQLFTSGAQGAWYDPSDFSTLFQNAAGTTPVTAVEQPVRLMLDRSRGLVLGSELVTNGGFDTDSDWIKGAGWTIAGGVATHAAGTVSNLDQANVTTPGKWYEFTINATASGGSWALQLAGGATTIIASGLTTGSFAFLALAATGNTTLRVRVAGTGTTLEVDNISVRELPGNHALAPNDASRPVLRARYNQLLNSEDFSTSPGGWTQTGVTVSGQTITATAGAGHHRISRTTGVTTPATVSAEASAGTVNRLTIYDGSSVNNFATFELSGAGSILAAGANSTATISSLGAGRYRCVVSYGSTNLPNGNTFFGISDPNSIGTWGSSSFTAAGTETLVVHNTQLLTAADQAATGGAYQRIAAATDYDTSNPVWRPYLAFDGSDDSFSTSAIDFSGTDEMTVFAGVTKLTNPTVGAQVMLELSADRNTNNNAFTLASPADGVVIPTLGYTFASKGTNSVGAQVLTGYPAPITNVLTGIADISGDVVTLRANGAQIATNTGDQGTGNYGNYPLFIGRRNNTSNPFNGRLYGLTVLGRTATAPELTAMETWIAGKTGVTLP